MNVLIGFEESQAVCIAFRKLGHNSFSNDLKKCSGGHAEWHLQIDIFEATPSPDRQELRSKTYPGIAAAIAAQYSI